MSWPRRRTVVACIGLFAIAVSSDRSAALQRHRTARPGQSAQGEAKDDNADESEAADRKVVAAAQNGDRLFEQHKWADARAAYDRVLLETGNWSLPAVRRVLDRDVQCSLKLGEIDAALRQVAVLWGKRSPPDMNRLRNAARDKSSVEEWRTELANPEFTYRILEQIARVTPNTADPEICRRLALSRVKLDLEFARLLDPDSVSQEAHYGWDSGYADAGWWWRNRPVQKTRDDDEEDEDNQRSSVPRNAAGQSAFLKPPAGYQPQLGRSSKILYLLSEVERLDPTADRDNAAQALLHRADLSRRLYGPGNDPQWVRDIFDYQVRERPAFSPVEGGSKWRRGGVVAAVQFGGAHECSPVRRQDGGPFPDLAPLLRKALECDPTWSSGETFAGKC